MTMLANYPQIKPKPGLVLEAYMSRADIGSGIRMFVVTRVGRKFIHLFYAPRLTTIRLKHSEWAQLFVAPVVVFDPIMFRTMVLKRTEQYARLGMRYSAKEVQHVLRLGLVHGPALFGRPCEKGKGHGK